MAKKGVLEITVADHLRCKADMAKGPAVTGDQLSPSHGPWCPVASSHTCEALAGF